jgi:serine/threonine protein kinase
MASRHQQAKEIFLDASELSGPAQAELLARVCGADAELRADVEFLLNGDARPKVLVDEPVLSSPGLAPLLAEAADDEVLPEWIGTYRIVRRIGEGGMGVVFEAEQSNPQRRVALKMVRPGFFSARMLRRLEREVRILGRLQHPGIERVLEADSVDFPQGRVPYFVAEYIDGLTLTSYARQNGLSVSDRVELLVKVCDAVQYAHQNRVIHRDLKPDNILVDALGQPKVLDFGVARMLDADSGEWAQVSLTGQFVGTLPYMSPEQLGDAASPPDTRMDIYALGVIAFEVLSGQLPYDLRGRSPTDAARIIRDQSQRRLGGLNPVCRGDLTTIINKALAKELAARYQSVGELAEDLRRYLRREPILAHRPSTAYQVRKLVARHKLTAALLAALFVTSAVSAVGMTVLYFGQRAATLEAKRSADEAAQEAAQAKYQAASAEAMGNFFQSFVTQPPDAEWRDYHRQIVDLLAARVARDFQGQPHAEARTRLSLGWAYLNRGDSAQAEEQMRAALRIWQAAHGEHDVWAITAGVALASCLRARGALDEARQIAQTAWDAAQTLPPTCWRAKLDAANILGVVLDDLGDAAAAELLARETYALATQYTPNDPVTRGGAALNLAVTLWSRGNISAAEPFAREAYALTKAGFGENHPITARALNALASVLRDLGRYAEAEEAARKAVSVQRTVSADGGPELIRYLRTLVAILIERGAFEAAEPLIRETLAALRSQPGAHDEELAAWQAYLGRCLTGLGRDGEAETVPTENSAPSAH